MSFSISFEKHAIYDIINNIPKIYYL